MTENWEKIENPKLNLWQRLLLVKTVFALKSLIMVANSETDEYILVGAVDDKSRKQAQICVQGLNQHKAE